MRKIKIFSTPQKQTFNIQILVGVVGLEPTKHTHVHDTAKQTASFFIISPPERHLRISYVIRRAAAAVSALGDKNQPLTAALNALPGLNDGMTVSPIEIFSLVRGSTPS